MDKLMDQLQQLRRDNKRLDQQMKVSSSNYLYYSNEFSNFYKDKWLAT